MKRKRVEDLERLERGITSYSEEKKRKKEYLILTLYLVILGVLFVFLFLYKDAFVHEEITIGLSL